MLTGAITSAVACRGLLRDRRLRQKGAWAQGVVTRLHPTKLGSDPSGPSTPMYCPVIAWTTADGRPMETESHVARALHRNAPPGTPVTVYYDPADPSRWTPSSAGTRIYWLVAAAGAVFALIGVGIALVMVFWGPSFEKCEWGASDYSTSCP
ncbi:DUF3592 domain-containing protein [Streptomyces sp. NPDC050147]|uniref:DUF3592 domain-containing protein n=1 Tax=Streptomyces sp. NPDC050147 TaxID=3155513 RepID=UPI0034465268